IEVPPLRERPEDIPVLLNHFLAMFSETHTTPIPEVTPEALKALAAYPWQGNVRELRNVAERLGLRCRNGVVDIPTLPQEITRDRRETGSSADAAGRAAGAPPPQMLFQRLITDGASFWSEVYEPFMARDLTRHEVRELVRLG